MDILHGAVQRTQLTCLALRYADQVFRQFQLGENPRIGGLAGHVVFGGAAYLTQALHHATVGNRISHRVQHAGQTSRGLQRNRHVEQIALSIRDIRSGAETLRSRIPQLAVNLIGQIHNRPLNLSDPRIQRVQIGLRRSVSPRRSIIRLATQTPRIIPRVLGPGRRFLRLRPLHIRLRTQLPRLRACPLGSLLNVAQHPVIGPQVGSLHEDAMLG